MKRKRMLTNGNVARCTNGRLTTVKEWLAENRRPRDPNPVYWLSEPPDACQLCGQPIAGSFADAWTKSGVRGSLDLKCLRIAGVGVGEGKGQIYQHQPDGRWLKIEG